MVILSVAVVMLIMIIIQQRYRTDRDIMIVTDIFTGANITPKIKKVKKGVINLR